MKSAIYGRMKIGRCIQQEPDTSEATMHDNKFLGCSRDILSLADEKCSGLSECDIRPVEIQTTTNCYSYLKLYLEVSYECMKGLVDSDIKTLKVICFRVLMCVYNSTYILAILHS